MSGGQKHVSPFPPSRGRGPSEPLPLPGGPRGSWGLGPALSWHGSSEGCLPGSQSAAGPSQSPCRRVSCDPLLLSGLRPGGLSFGLLPGAPRPSPWRSTSQPGRIPKVKAREDLRGHPVHCLLNVFKHRDCFVPIKCYGEPPHVKQLTSTPTDTARQPQEAPALPVWPLPLIWGSLRVSRAPLGIVWTSLHWTQEWRAP